MLLVLRTKSVIIREWVSTSGTYTYYIYIYAIPHENIAYISNTLELGEYHNP